MTNPAERLVDPLDLEQIEVLGVQEALVLGDGTAGHDRSPVE
ncbi:hypothetical protein [Streptomyces shaanxiensis]